MGIFLRILIFQYFITIVSIISAQQTQGFFLNDNKPKVAIIPPHKDYSKPAEPITVHVSIQASDTIAQVPKYIYGNNANVYMTQMLTEERLIHHLKLLSPNVLRYPGGNLSNLFFWNAKPGILPKDVPDTIWIGLDNPYAEKYWYGNNNDPSALSVDNYYKMLDAVNAEGIICINYSYARYGLSEDPVAAAAHLAAEWVRYDNGRTKFWEIGNENFGFWQAGYKIDTTQNKDGQPEIISGKIYGEHFNVFVDSMRKAANETGADIKIGAALVEVAKNEDWKNLKSWNDKFFQASGNTADFFVIHTYFTSYDQDSDIPTILNSPLIETKKMLDHMWEVCKRNEIDIKPIALTEWNIFAVRSKQSCSFISGIHAAMVLGEMIKNKYGISCRWNLANGYDNGDDHGMFNIGDEPDVPKWNPRPAFFTMYYFQKFFGDYMVKSVVHEKDKIIVYSSKFSSGETGIILVNKNETDQIVKINHECPKTKRYYYYSLTGGDENGDFSQKVYINDHAPTNKTGGPINNLTKIEAMSAITGSEGIIVKSPKYSIQYILIEN